MPDDIATTDPEAQELAPLMLDGKSWNRPAVLQHVCSETATSNKSLATILKGGRNGETLPSAGTFLLWLSQDATLSEIYARAKEAQADYLAEEIMEISDDARNDYMDAHDGGRIADKENVQRSRLRVESRKWLAAKLRPRKYGDRLQQELTGPGGGPIQVSGSKGMTDEELERIASDTPALPKP